MPNVHPWKASFTRGEISDKMLARQDWQGWRDASECLENVLVQPHGGATRRAGTAFLAEAGDSTHPVRLERFIFDVDTTYGLEFGNGYLRFFRNRALIREANSTPASMLTVTGTGSEVTLTTEIALFTSTAVDAGREIEVDGGGFYRIVTVINATTATADVFEDPVATSPFAAGTWNITGIPHRIVTPYVDSEVFELRCEAVGDVIYVTHAAHPVGKIQRITEETFRYLAVAFNPPATDQIPWAPNAALELSGTTGTVTATSSVPIFLAGDLRQWITAFGGRAQIVATPGNDTLTLEIQDAFPSVGPFNAGEWFLSGNPYTSLNPPNTFQATFGIGAVVAFNTDWECFRATDVGAYISAWGGLLKITAVTDTQHITATIVSQLVDAPPNTGGVVIPWGFGTWAIEREVWTAGRGYPTCAAFHQDRLASAGRGVWLSQSGDYENFAGGSPDNSAISRSIPGEDEAVWIESADKVLAVGTPRQEVGIEGGADKVVTPDACTARTKAWNGSAAIEPLNVGSALVFAQRGAHAVRAMSGNFDLEEWAAPQLSLIAEHLFRGQIVQMAALTVPDTVLLVVMDDGILCTNTFEQAEKITSCWAHQLTLGDFQSVCVLPYPGGEEILTVVERTIAGIPRKYIEVFDGSLNVDAALIFEDAENPIEEVRGLRHLEGQSVTYKVDDVAYAGTVSQGILALGSSGAKVEIGLGYASRWIPVEPDAQTQTGTIQGRKSRWSERVVRWWCTSGTPTVAGENWVRPEGSVTPYTGDTRVSDSGWVKHHGKPTLIIEQATPFPATVLGVSGMLMLEDG